MAEGVGFEPTVLSYNGFQDRRLKPLGHPSVVFIVIQLPLNVKQPVVTEDTRPEARHLFFLILFSIPSSFIWSRAGYV